MLNKVYKSAAKIIPASKYGGAVIEGKKLSPEKFKDFIVNENLKSGGLSGTKLDKILIEKGMDKSQMAKRKHFIKMITGTDVHKMTKKEVIRAAARVQARINASRYTSEKLGEKPGGMAGQLRRRKEDKEGALRGALVSKDNIKTNAGTIGVKAKEYGVAIQSGKTSVSPSKTTTPGFGGGYTTSSSSGLGGNHGQNIGAPKMPIGFGPKI